MKDLDLLKLLIIDDKFVIKNSVAEIVEKLSLGIDQLRACYKLGSEQQIVIVVYDVTYLSTYSRKLKNGKQNGMTEVKPIQKRKEGSSRAKKLPIRNLFLFMVSMLNAKYPTFITCAFFTTNGSASFLTDKIVTALVQIYKARQILLTYKVVDGDRYIYSKYVTKIYNVMDQHFKKCDKFIDVKKLQTSVPLIILNDDLHELKRCRNFLLE
ncbi:Hypothetical_protein [Hexamita inflata]|uniref:Hypothetical_protein n=1 Tax=Hexamita inflata TaxID=28002 RepID=A0AA86P9T1_9EUKA|nr:Hypothetical protein HINF_LOCUS21278 [Hexamita inflata]